MFTFKIEFFPLFLARLHEVHRAIVVTSVVPVYVYVYVRVTLSVKVFIPPAKRSFIIPPAKRSFRGVYCFQSVRNSVIPSFRDSVNILTSLLNNLSSFCPMFFKFSTHLHHKTTHVWYEFRGQRVSSARVMGLFKPIHRMFAIVLIVHTL